MKRVIIHSAEMKAKNTFMRIRDEGDKITMTYKQFDDISTNDTREIEIVVNDFENAIALLSAAGLPFDSSQELRRETLADWPQTVFGDVTTRTARNILA